MIVLPQGVQSTGKPKKHRLVPPLPHSPTRFLIPMIDVLLVLFGLFMVAQVMRKDESTTAGKSDPQSRTLDPDRERDTAEALRRKLAEITEQLGKERESMRNASAAQLAGMISVRSLDIDPLDGHLTTDSGETIRNEVQAKSLIDLDRRRQNPASGDPEKKLVYLLRYPKSKDSGYPTVRQKLDLARWFTGTVLTYEIPELPSSRENK